MRGAKAAALNLRSRLKPAGVTRRIPPLSGLAPIAIVAPEVEVSAAEFGVVTGVTTPVVHKSHWRWLIVGYFFTGGVAAGSLAIASIARLAGGDDRVVRAGRYAALVALIPSPPLLILDLGRPERFWRMIVHWNRRSPMSHGSWALLLFSAVCGGSALHEAACDGFFGPVLADGRGGKFSDKTLAVLSLPPALFLGGYTGILLGATAVPLWARLSRFLGPLFLSSAFATGGAATMLAARLLGDGHPPTLGRAERVIGLAEIGVLTAACAADPAARQLLVARPAYRLGLTASVLGTILGPRLSNRAAIAGPLMTLAGGLLLRAVVVFAGNASADEPAATFAMTTR